MQNPKPKSEAIVVFKDDYCITVHVASQDALNHIKENIGLMGKIYVYNYELHIHVNTCYDADDIVNWINQTYN
jgi:hypothetical protein